MPTLAYSVFYSLITWENWHTREKRKMKILYTNIKIQYNYISLSILSLSYSVLKQLLLNQDLLFFRRLVFFWLFAFFLCWRYSSLVLTLDPVSHEARLCCVCVAWAAASFFSYFKVKIQASCIREFPVAFHKKTQLHTKNSLHKIIFLNLKHIKFHKFLVSSPISAFTTEWIHSVCLIVCAFTLCCALPSFLVFSVGYFLLKTPVTHSALSNGLMLFHTRFCRVRMSPATLWKRVKSRWCPHCRSKRRRFPSLRGGATTSLLLLRIRRSG